MEAANRDDRTLTRRMLLRRAGVGALAVLTVPTVADGATALRRGSSGPAVLALNRRLAELRYLRREQISSTFGSATFHAVVAFQKHTGLARDGVVGPRTRAALVDARRPGPRLGTSGRRIEVWRERQVALLVRDGVVERAVAVSTGKRGYMTPRGRFSVYRRNRMAWSYSYQVWLPWAAFFNRGIAFHEHASVPPYPASHGCVRVPAPFAREVYDFTRIGTRVDVL